MYINHVCNIIKSNLLKNKFMVNKNIYLDINTIKIYLRNS